eukprot:gene5671-7057_t
MPLSLVQRKSLRDHEPALKEALESIKNSTGEEYQVEIDLEGIVSKFTDKWCAEDPGSFFYKNAITNFAYCVEQECKKDLTKEAFVEATPSRKITFRINEDKKNTDWWKIVIENGVVVLLFRIQPSNLGDISYLPLYKSIPVPGVYSLETRLNMKEYQEKWDEALESIKSATGETYTLDEASLEAVYPKVDENSKVYFGRFFGDILTNLAYCITEKCKDDMIKEAFVESTPKKTIKFAFDAKQSDYWVFKFTDGELVLSFKAIVNVSDISYYAFEKHL